MNKGISVFGIEGIRYKRRLDIIKKTGFNTIIDSADKRYVKTNGRLSAHVKYARKIGLMLSSLHASYDSDSLPHFFMDDWFGDFLERRLKHEVKLCKKYGFRCLVAHFSGKPSEIGLERIRRILSVCEKCAVPLAVENTNNLELFDYIMKNIKHRYLAFCYDSGHNNVFAPDKKYLKEYGDKLICLHLHDNDGKQDLHTISKFGIIDWKKVAKQLSECDFDSLDSEVLARKTPGFKYEQLLKLAYEDLCMIERLIQKSYNEENKK